MDHSLINPNQLRYYGIEVQENQMLVPAIASSMQNSLSSVIMESAVSNIWFSWTSIP